MPILKNPFSGASNPVPTLESTRQLAAYFHRDQTESSGAPYINHPVRVAQNLIKLRDILPNSRKNLVNENTLMAALLHDVLEDCYIDEAQTRKVNADDLRGWGYNEEVIAMVQLVTKPEGERLSYDEKITLLIAAQNQGAMLIKLADNMDNSHPLRQLELAQKEPERAQRLSSNYTRSIRKLTKALDLDVRAVLHLIEHKYQPLGPSAIEPLA